MLIDICTYIYLHVNICIYVQVYWVWQLRSPWEKTPPSIWTYMYIYIYVYVYVYAFIFVRTYVCICIYLYNCRYIGCQGHFHPGRKHPCMCRHTTGMYIYVLEVYVYLYTKIYINTNINIDRHIHINIGYNCWIYWRFWSSTPPSPLPGPYDAVHRGKYSRICWWKNCTFKFRYIYIYTLTLNLTICMTVTLF
jgi:hypothetical protein